MMNNFVELRYLNYRTYMELPAKHAAELAKRNYPLGIDGKHVFAADEITLLQRYGHWLEALADGRIQAITADQERFISVTKEEHEAKSTFEIAWMKLMGRRDFEASDISHYDVYDPKQKWFSDSGRAAMRKPHWRS